MDQQSSSVVVALLSNNAGVAMIGRGDYNGAIYQCARSLDLIRPLLHNMVVDDSCFVESFAEEGGRSRPGLSNSSYAPQHAGVCPVAAAAAPPNVSFHATDDEQNPQQQMQELLQQANSPLVFSNLEAALFFNCACNESGESQLRAEAGGFLFRDPIEIPIHTVLKSSPSTRLFVKLSIVFIYNLALAFHLSAIQTRDNFQLERAKRLYEYAFQMHLEENCDVTLLYSMALLNNLGLIYKATDEDERSQKCFRNMLSTMMYLLASDEARNISQWGGLLSNVLGLILQDRVAPAA